MAVFHYLHLRVFVHETEDRAKVQTALRAAAQTEDLAFEETFVEGSHGNRIVIMEADVKSAPTQKRLFAKLAEDDPEGFAHLVRTQRERVDDNLNFHARLDKQAAAGGTLRLAEDDDAITLRAKIRSFESKRSEQGQESALQQLESFFLGIRTSRQRVVGQ